VQTDATVTIRPLMLALAQRVSWTDVLAKTQGHRVFGFGSHLPGARDFTGPGAWNPKVS